MVTPKKRDILAHARRIELSDIVGKGLPALTPEEDELKETGVFEKARRELMTSRETIYQIQQEKYLREMADELNLKVIAGKEFRKAERGMFSLGFVWTNGWTKKEKAPPKPKKVKWKIKPKQTAVLGDLWIKFCNEVAHPCSMQDFEKFLSPTKGFRETKRDIIKFFEPKRKAVKRRERRVKPKKDVIDQMVKSVVQPTPIKLPTTPKKRTRKRTKSHTNRTGKTPQKLRKHIKNGKRLFAFADNIWKVRPPKRRRKKRK